MLLLPGQAAGQFETAFVDGWGTDPSSDFGVAAAAGARKVRIPVNWNMIAPSDPSYPANHLSPGYSWQTLDTQILAAKAQGLEPIVALHAESRPPPSWAINWDFGPDSTTPKIAEYKAFAKAAATRYSGKYSPDGRGIAYLPRVRYWQAWNEPNLSIFLRPQRRKDGRMVSPGNYRKMVNAFSRAVKDVAANNFVLAGGTAPWGHSGVAPLTFMRSMLCLDKSLKPRCKARARFDIWGHHPYTLGGPNKEAPLASNVSLGDLPEMRRVLRAAIGARKIVPTAGRGVQWWVDEFSWDSGPPDPYLIGPRTHARWVAEAFYRMWSSGVSLVAWFLLKDHPMYTSRHQSGLYYGEGTRDGKPKLALRAFRFPFIALARNGQLRVWGRVPPPFTRDERVLIQRQTRSGWKDVATLKTTRHGIFSRRWRSSLKRGYFRATLRNGREQPSLKFSIAPTKDVFLEKGPFGCGGWEPC